jgi:hypothetical protein
MPLQNTSGSDTTDAYGGGAAIIPNYIENVFSTWLYTGTGATQSINNGIDLSTKGGLTWFKCRSTGFNNRLADTSQGVGYSIISNSAAAQQYYADSLTSFNTNGFTLGADSSNGFNNNGNTYASWTFRKQPKFFDVLTYNGNGDLSQTLSHNLGSSPACVIFKKTNNNEEWTVWHSSLGVNQYLVLNATYAVQTLDGLGPASGALTSTTITVPRYLNSGGGTFVAYLFAHNAGGFGLTGTDNVISCGSFTTDGSGNASVTLGYEPQWLLVKRSSSVSTWWIVDSMRGYSVTPGNSAQLYPNSSGAEYVDYSYFPPNSTGFTVNGGSAGLTSSTCIYIAIRRGPMAVPTDATKVFAPIARTGTGTNTSITTGFVTDSTWSSQRVGGYRGVFDRLRGSNNLLFQNSTGAEDATYTDTLTSFANNTGINVGADATWGGINLSGASEATYSFGRAPSFFDEVCYTGTGSATTQTHNLNVAPELMIVKARGPSGTSTQWRVYSSATGATQSARLNQADAFGTNTAAWNSTAPTSSVFTVGTDTSTNEPSFTFVAYLFATCLGVSKVGSYTGNGTTQAIACGFTGGARFVLIKCTSATGDWYVYDTARGMSTLTDPYLLLNSTAAESTTLGSVTTTTGGFTVNSAILAAINTNGATFVFLAIA